MPVGALPSAASTKVFRQRLPFVVVEEIALAQATRDEDYRVPLADTFVNQPVDVSLRTVEFAGCTRRR